MSPKNKQVNPQIREFIDFAYAGYLNKFGEKMIIGVAEATCIKRLLGSIDLERLKRYWDYFLNYAGDDYILRGTTKDLRGFSGQINRVIQKFAPARRVTLGHPNLRNKPKSINPQAQKLWQQALRYIKGKINKQSYDTWFAQTQGYDLAEEILKIAVPNEFTANWLRENYTELISEAIGRLEFKLMMPGE